MDEWGSKRARGLTDHKWLPPPTDARNTLVLRAWVILITDAFLHVRERKGGYLCFPPTYRTKQRCYFTSVFWESMILGSIESYSSYVSLRQWLDSKKFEEQQQLRIRTANQLKTYVFFLLQLKKTGNQREVLGKPQAPEDGVGGIRHPVRFYGLRCLIPEF